MQRPWEILIVAAAMLLFVGLVYAFIFLDKAFSAFSRFWDDFGGLAVQFAIWGAGIALFLTVVAWLVFTVVRRTRWEEQ